jgi:TolB protein
MIRRALLLAIALTMAGAGLAVAAKSPRKKHAGAESKAATSAPPFAGRVVYVGEGEDLYVCDGGCEKPACITCAGKKEQAFADNVAPIALSGRLEPAAATSQSELPTFSPDGSQIAYASSMQGGRMFAVNVYDLNRRTTTGIFQTPDRPIYFYWLPEGQRIFFLASDEESLKLILAEAREAKPVRVLLTGLPLFFDWNQAISDLAFHYTPAEEAGPEQVGLMNVTGHDQRVVKDMARGGAPFRGPAWSPDGAHLAYVIDNKNGQFMLMVANGDGGSPKPMVGLAPTTTALVWAPDSKHLAFSTLKEKGKLSYDGINLLDIGTGNVSTLVSDSVIAFNFSPDGRWLAYIGTTESSNTWNVIATGGGASRKLCDFVASTVQSIAYQVFDQYALSHRIWSPDSRALVFAGVMLKPGQAPSEQMPPPSVWVLPIDGQAPRALADGSVAFWSPR